MDTTAKRFKVPILMSYAYLRNHNDTVLSQVMDHPDIELLCDSGAFTAKNAGKEIELRDYMKWLETWGPRMFGYVALDKLQDPEQTDKNLRIMVRAGLKPIPVHVFGDTAARMDELFELSDWVALGGFKRPHRGAAPKSYVKQKMAWAKGRNVHWLGYTQEPMIRAFKPFSCDCSSWATGCMYGRVTMYRGRGKWVSYQWTEVKEALAERRGEMLAEVGPILDLYRTSFAEWIDRRYWWVNKAFCTAKDSVVRKIPMRSWVRYSLDIRRLFGTRLFIAMEPGFMPELLDAISIAKEEGWLNAA